VATRAVVFVKADNENIGLMAFVAVGMAEVGSCEVGVYEGQKVKKGDELGMFRFGGSTYCLIFGPGVELEFGLGDVEEGGNLRVNSRLATVL
jgi:phosphatidylserine decarboxylase